MRILVEPSAHHHLNIGDVSMLSVTTERLHSLWPEAVIGVLTASPDRLATYCPHAVPVPAYGRQLWFDLPYTGHAVHRRLPAVLSRQVRSAEHALRRVRPQAAASIIRARTRLTGLGRAELDEFLDWMFGADAVVVVGAGLLADVFEKAAITVLELLETFLARGAPAAMFGQGIGPLTNAELTAWCRRVLPRLDLIALREQRAGLPVLRALGVGDSSIVTTGDDAIELAARVPRPTKAGEGIGVGLRRARYAEVVDEALTGVGRVLRNAAAERGVPLVAVPISRVPKEGDAQVIAQALGVAESGPVDAETPAAVVAKVQRCRIVITGSYHAGVFALAQGIPVVGVAQSDYYVDKFLGLSEQFGGVCPVIQLRDPAYEQRLGEAVAELWSRADELRPQLLVAAEQQIERSWGAYRRFQALVESKVPA